MLNPKNKVDSVCRGSKLALALLNTSLRPCSQSKSTHGLQRMEVLSPACWQVGPNARMTTVAQSMRRLCLWSQGNPRTKRTPQMSWFGESLSLGIAVESVGGNCLPKQEIPSYVATLTSMIFPSNLRVEHNSDHLRARIE